MPVPAYERRYILSKFLLATYAVGLLSSEEYNQTVNGAILGALDYKLMEWFVDERLYSYSD